MNDIIQIAGVHDLNEADMIVSAGAQYLGFPLRLPDGREDLSERDARAIIAALGSRVVPVLITYLSDAAEIAHFCQDMGVHTVQLHGPIEPAELKRLTELNPTLSIFKSLIVEPGNLAELEAQVAETAKYVTAYITDTFDASTGRRGATGKIHDWAVSRRLVRRSPRPVILAGGLTQTNVRDAILEVRPAGVDSHTGVEGPDGRKDPQFVRQFVSAAQDGFRLMRQEAISQPAAARRAPCKSG